MEEENRSNRQEMQEVQETQGTQEVRETQNMQDVQEIQELKETIPTEEEPNPSHRYDFHKSFWPTLGVLLALTWLGSSSLFGYGILNNYFNMNTIGNLLPLMGLIAAVMLRIKLKTTRPGLAKGFMWAAIVAVGIPMLIFLLLLGTCMVIMVGS